MRQGSNPKGGRSRGRGGSSNKKPGGPMRNGSFDNGPPNVRTRGNAHQLMDKFLALARDASAQGDRVAAENYLQHADHYYRIVTANGMNGRGQQRPGHGTPASPTTEAEDAEDALEAEGQDDGEDQPEVAAGL